MSLLRCWPVLLLLAPPALAASGDEGGSPFSPGAPPETLRERGLVATGLKAVYPREAACPEISSPFGSETRYDGSRRPFQAYGGLHSGMDISCPEEGAPLLVIADGTLVHKVAGGRMVGNRVVFRHRPEDTGHPVWLYSAYQHLADMPELEIGAKVTAGQPIGACGRTGTVGGHYGAQGYAHLHLTVYLGPTAEYSTTGRSAIPVGGRFIDPLAIYFGKALDSDAVLAFPEAERIVVLPYRGPDGAPVPAGTRLVWPFACPARRDGPP
ncbi:MAG: M23 family metallopeptidase [Magnetospirillum sp. WYHS-4]